MPYYKINWKLKYERRGATRIHTDDKKGALEVFHNEFIGGFSEKGDVSFKYVGTEINIEEEKEKND